jgi:hypothetical protein
MTYHIQFEHITDDVAYIGQDPQSFRGRGGKARPLRASPWHGRPIFKLFSAEAMQGLTIDLQLAHALI